MTCVLRIRETQRMCTHRGKTMWVQSKKAAIFKPRRGLRRNQTCQHLDLGPPASRRVRNTFLLFKPPGLWYFAMAALKTNPYYIIFLFIMLTIYGLFLQLKGRLHEGNNLCFNADVSRVPRTGPGTQQELNIYLLNKYNMLVTNQ